MQIGGVLRTPHELCEVRAGEAHETRVSGFQVWSEVGPRFSPGSPDGGIHWGGQPGKIRPLPYWVTYAEPGDGTSWPSHGN